MGGFNEYAITLVQGSYKGLDRGVLYRVIKRDTRSLDNRSYENSV